MPKTWFNFAPPEPGEIKLAIRDEIGGYGVTAKDFCAALEGQDPTKKIKLHLCSSGGCVFAGNEIYNALKSWKGGVETTLGAVCASITTVIACAGSKVTMARNGLYMVHNPWACEAGDSATFRKTADILDTLKTTILATYVAKTGKEAAELAPLMDAETWMTADEAKAAGFVDAIAEEEEDEDEDMLNSLTTKFQNAAKAISRRPKMVGGKNKPEPKAQTPEVPQTPTKTPAVEPKENLMKQYANGKLRIFNDAAADLEAVKAEAKSLYLAKLARDKGIREIVNLVKSRDNKDFTGLADEFIAEDKTESEFASAIIRSDKFVAVVKAPAASSIEVIEPLDSLKGTPGFAFVNSAQFKANKANFANSTKASVAVEVPAFKNVATGATKTYEAVPGIVELGVRPLAVEDLFGSGQTDANTVIYLQETDLSEIEAGAIAETAALKAADVTYTQKTAPVASLGDFIPVPEVLINDLPAVASLINQRLPYLVDRSVENSLLNADGTGANFTGILHSTGLQAIDQAGTTGVSALLDLLLKMQTLVRWQNMGEGKAQGGFEPDAYVINPLDWEAISLAKDSVGQFYRTNPFSVVDGRNYVWGKQVAVTPAVAQGSPICGAFKLGAQVFNRQGMLIEMTNSDGTNFQNRIVTIRAARRLALAVWRPANFVQAANVNPQS